jgi:diguanylate cyclase (GGDEF)-like protein
MGLPINEALQKIPIFNCLSTEPLDALSEIGREQSVPAGGIIFSEGDVPEALYLIVSGTVEVLKKGWDGPAARLALLKSGDFFGEMALIDGAPRSATVRTIEPCELFVIHRHHFLEMLSQTPRLIPAVFASIIDKMQNFNKQFLLELLEKQKLRDEMARETYRSISLIAAAANEAATINEALQLVLDRVCEYIHYPVGHVYLADEQTGESLYSSGVWFLNGPERFTQFKRLSEMTRYTRGDGLPGKVLLQAKPAWAPDLSRIMNCPRTQVANSAALVSGFAFPVTVNKRVVAVLELYSDELSDIDHLLLESTEQIGAQLGRSIERKLLQEKLTHNAFHDPLTDLPNRALFLDHLAMALGRAKRDPQYLYAVLFVDLDRFKLVNDSLGHQAGDELLKEVARRLRHCVRTTDTVSRLGGDEFGLLLEDFPQLSHVPRAIERIRAELQRPVILETGEEVYTNGSIGVSLSSANYIDTSAPLRDADTAMYRAKSKGPGNYVVFDPSMHESAVKRLRIDNDLRRALDRDELRVFYQPIVMVETASPVGFEALVRWQHPTLGLLGPLEFMPIAEDTELIMPLTEWVLAAGCRQAKEWNESFRSPVPISVSMNLAPKFFVRRDLYEVMRSFLAQLSISPACLKLEITEGQIMEDPPAVARMLERLADLGVRVHIDDFGTGYSSLAYLSTLRADGLKIDRTFVSKIGIEERTHSIIRSIVSLGEHLQMDVIAEGVETEQQRAYLQGVHCKHAQGYLFARPMEPEKATEFLARALFPGMNEQFPVTEFTGFQVISS